MTSYRQTLPKACIVLIALLGPAIADANLQITEIAWMGSHASANHEWIELQNTGTEAILLEGWKLRAKDDSPTIELSGTLAPSDFLILERTSDETLPATLANILYSGALSNGGEELVITDPNGVSTELYDFADSWPAGDNTSKETMQRTDTGWITAPPTPRQSDLTLADATTEEQREAEEEANTDVDPVISTNLSVARPALIDFSGGINLPEHLLSGEIFTLEASLSNNTQPLQYGEVVVNFGDGTYTKQPLGTPFHHRYYQPGEYTVRYEVRAQPWSREPSLTEKHIVTVHPNIFVVHTTEQGLKIEYMHFPLDISGWSLIYESGQTFTLPPMSYLDPDTPLTLPYVVLKSKQPPTALVNPHGIQFPLEAFSGTGEEEAPANTATRITTPPKQQALRPSYAAASPAAATSVPTNTSTNIENSLRADASLAAITHSVSRPLLLLALLSLMGLGLFGVLVRFRYQQLRSQDRQMDLFQE